MRRSTKITIALIVVGSAATGAFAVLLRHGFSARDHPLSIEAFVARHLRRLAIPYEARTARNPLPVTADIVADARAHFADHCATCHANDGSGHTEIGQNLYPKVPDMREADTQDLTDGELFYIIHNGIRFTGMPAWGPVDPAADQDSWKLVHFIRHLPELTAVEITEMKRMNPKSRHQMEENEEEQRFLRGEEESAPPSRQH